MLVNNNIELRNNNIIKKNTKNKGKFTIPAIFLNYTKGNRLSIKINKSYLNIVEENKVYLINSDLVRLVNDEAFNYFMHND